MEPEGVVLLERASPGTRRVLADAGCAVLEGSGPLTPPAHDAPGGLAGLSEGSARELVGLAMAAIDRGEVSRIALLDQRCSAPEGGDRTVRRPPHVAHHPVELLEWLVGQPELASAQSQINAYLYCSDPDDILPRVPYFFGPRDHPAGSEAGAALVARVCCASAHRPAGAHEQMELALPGGLVIRTATR